MEERNEIKERIEKEDFPKTRAEAIDAEALGDKIGAGLFWGLVSAPRRSAHYLAWGDVERSAELLSIEIPDHIKKMSGLGAAKEWEKFLRGEFK